MHSHLSNVCYMSSHLTFFSLIIVRIFLKTYISFIHSSPTSCHYLRLRSEHSTQQPVLKNKINIPSRGRERDVISHPQNTIEIIILDNIILSTFRKVIVRKNMLNFMVASIFGIYSALNFFVNSILIYYCRFKILNLCYILQVDFVTNH